MPPKKGHVISEETKEKIRLSLLGKKHSEQRKQNIRRSKIGKKWTVEQTKSHKDCHSGEKHWNWKGGKSKDGKNGYIRLSKSRKREHRDVAEKCLGRKLSRKEVVHHINLNPSDNRPENLYVFKNQNQHRWFHTKIKNNPDHAKTLKSNIV